MMFCSFVGEGLALLGVMHFGHNPYLFMAFSAFAFLCYGDIFSNFPATCADTFGAKFAAGNAGTLYTAKGTAAALVPVASVLALHGGWNQVFVCFGCLSMLAGFSAKLVLQPLRRRWIFNSALQPSAPQPNFQA